MAAAASDLRYLLARGYPRGASLTLVGNRYALRQPARQVLHRGVWPPAVAASRRQKQLAAQALAGKTLAVDGHNVLLTVECALRGWPLVVSDDGWLRDIGQLSRRYRPSAVTDRALALLAVHLAAVALREFLILYDAPMSGSGELAAATRAVLQSRGLNGRVAAVPVPEAELLATAWPVASSDSALIDAAAVAVDLAGEIVRQLPQVRLLYL